MPPHPPSLPRHRPGQESKLQPNKGKTHLLIGHSVVPPEESRGDVICHHHVHSVVVMRQENTEDPNHAEEPANPVVPPQSSRGIWKEEEFTTAPLFKYHEGHPTMPPLLLVKPVTLILPSGNRSSGLQIQGL